MAFEFFEPFPDVRGNKGKNKKKINKLTLKIDLFSKVVTDKPKITLEVKRGFKLGGINFMDANKGTGYVKFEHDPWAFRADKKTFDAAEAEKKPTEPKMTQSKYNSFETYFDTKFKNDDSLKIKTSSNKTVECNFSMKNLTFLGDTDCGNI